MSSVVSRRVCEVRFLCGVATPVAQTAAFVVQVAGPVAGMAGGVAALFRPEAGPFFLKAGSFCERPVRKAALCGTLHSSLIRSSLSVIGVS